MTIIVTGAAGFIGANIVQALNARGEKNIIAVDDLSPADKYRNLADLDIIDYLDKHEFLEAFRIVIFALLISLPSKCPEEAFSSIRLPSNSIFKLEPSIFGHPSV